MAAARGAAGGTASPEGAKVDDLGIPDDDEIAALERAHQVLRSTLDGVERRT